MARRMIIVSRCNLFNVLNVYDNPPNTVRPEKYDGMKVLRTPFGRPLDTSRSLTSTQLFKIRSCVYIWIRVSSYRCPKGRRRIS